MTLHRAENPSPFSEIRQLERGRTLMVIATSTLAATGFIIAAALFALGLI